jgi:hypothetical protein
MNAVLGPKLFGCLWTSRVMEAVMKQRRGQGVPLVS